MPSFYSQPLDWDEARDAFKSRRGMSAKEFYALADYLRGTAFTITRISGLQTLSRIKRKLLQLIEVGGTLADFREWITEQAPTWTRAYTELVFRQNVLGAYNRARWEEINDPELGDEFEWLMYDAVNDDRTRPHHAALDNKAWKKDEFPDEHWTPNGFQCRCEIRNLNEDLLDRVGADVDFDHPVDDDGNPVRPDEGFRSNQNPNFASVLRNELRRIRDELRS
jgi:SPP1 gp7 family putative phage head morphogenesis protein